MSNFWTKLEKPFFVLAPMAGYTDQTFRLMCKKYGADILYSEMISSEALFHNASKFKNQNSKLKIKESLLDNLYKTLKLIQFSRKERPYIVQIFGGNIEHMAFTGEYIASGKWHEDYLKIQKSNKLEIRNLKLDIQSIPSGIDVNMGCPVKDVVKEGSGAALLKDHDKAVKIIKALKKRVKNIPISVKTRLGWRDHKEILELARKLEKAGADAIAIHGRTYKEGFSGQVDWEMIEKVKKQVRIPVIGNGGIDIKNCKLIIENYGLDGYMVGRGALGKPWIFSELKIENEKRKTSDLKFIKQNILEHAKLLQKIKSDRGIIELRKHLAWYTKGIPKIKDVRKKLVRTNSYQEIVKIIGHMV